MKPLQDLFAQWLEAGGDWTKSQVYIESTNREGTTDVDTRGWVTQGELELKMGKLGAESMVNYLEENRPDQCRDHPDAPGVKDTSQSFPMNPHDANPTRMGHIIFSSVGYQYFAVVMVV